MTRKKLIGKLIKSIKEKRQPGQLVVAHPRPKSNGDEERKQTRKHHFVGEEKSYTRILEEKIPRQILNEKVTTTTKGKEIWIIIILFLQNEKERKQHHPRRFENKYYKIKKNTEKKNFQKNKTTIIILVCVCVC